MNSPCNPKPPFVPHDHNPVGSYRRTFTVPSEWAGMDVYLQFGAVKSFFYVWVNGEKLGFSKDSKTPAEWNITRFLKPGENVLAAEVYRWSDGSYLECQDFWRLAGIERDVYLYAAPRVRIRDYEVKAGLDAGYRNGRLDVTVELGGDALTGSRPASVSMALLDAAGKKVLGAKRPSVASGNGPAVVRFGANLANVARWSAETPHLYRLVLELADGKGKVRRGGHVEDRLSDERDQGRASPRQRRGGPSQRGQPARARSAGRPRHLGRVDAPRHRAHEAVEHQRRPDMPLS